MVALLLCHGSDLIHEVQCLTEIRESKRAHNVMLVHNFPVSPLRQLFMYLFEFLPAQRRHSAAAGDTSLAGQVRHISPTRWGAGISPVSVKACSKTCLTLIG